MTTLLVALAGGAGALARYELGGWIQDRVDRPYPVGTLAVNVTGSLLFGLFHSSAAASATIRLAGLGFLGGFTTFSTWMVETVRLGEEGGPAGLAAAGVNLAGMVAGGLAGVALGLGLAGWTG